MSGDIIAKSLEYYDKNNEKYSKIIKNIKYCKKDETSVPGTIKFNFYDKNKNLLFSSRIELIGVYHRLINTWIWGWSNFDFKKEYINTIRKIFTYGSNIDYTINDETAYTSKMLKKNLITSRFKIIDYIQVETQCAISSYLTKLPFILEWKEINLDNTLNKFVGQYSPYNPESSSFYFFIIDPPNVD